jgi:uncharacterized SAM-binding protein YcdF (DUF218 family)
MPFPKWTLIFIPLVIFLLILVLFWNRVSRYDHATIQPRSLPAGLVLGAALWDGRPSPALKERLDLAYQLYREGRVQYLILSGGKGDDGLSEAEGMKRYLADKGVPPDRLLLEDQSRNTAENIANSKGILLERNWEQIHLITHDYHMYRALRLAERAGIDATPAPVHSRVLFTPFYKVRECLAIIKMWVRETLG